MNSNTNNAAKTMTADWDAAERAIRAQPWRPGTGTDADRGAYEIRDVQILTAEQRPTDQAELAAIAAEANRRGYTLYNPRGGGMGIRESRYPS